MLRNLRSPGPAGFQALVEPVAEACPRWVARSGRMIFNIFGVVVK